MRKEKLLRYFEDYIKDKDHRVITTETQNRDLRKELKLRMDEVRTLKLETESLTAQLRKIEGFFEAVAAGGGKK
jgi:regulator of replication initiation timing